VIDSDFEFSEEESSDSLSTNSNESVEDNNNYKMIRKFNVLANEDEESIAEEDEFLDIDLVDIDIEKSTQVKTLFIMI